MIVPPPRRRLTPLPNREMTIPEIRVALEEVAEHVHSLSPMLASRIRTLSEATKRRPAVRRAPVRHPKMTEELAMMIREYAAAHPRAHMQDIAVRFDTNAGRVSEVLHGKR